MQTKPPKALPAGRWRADWKAAAAILKDRGAWDRPAYTLLERMLVNLATAEARHAEADREPYAEGSQGQPVLHPGYAAASRCDQAALAIARQLELTTATRGKRADDKEEAQHPLAAIDELAKRRRKRATGA